MTRTVGTLIDVARGNHHRIIFIVLFSEEDQEAVIAKRLINSMRGISRDRSKEMLVVWPEDSTSSREDVWQEFNEKAWPESILDQFRTLRTPIILAIREAFRAFNPLQHEFWLCFPANLREKPLADLIQGLRSSLGQVDPLAVLRDAKQRGGTRFLPFSVTITDQNHELSSIQKRLGRPSLKGLIPNANESVKRTAEAMRKSRGSVDRGAIARSIAADLRERGHNFSNRGVENFLRKIAAFDDIA